MLGRPRLKHSRNSKASSSPSPKKQKESQGNEIDAAIESWNKLYADKECNSAYVPEDHAKANTLLSTMNNLYMFKFTSDQILNGLCYFDSFQPLSGKLRLNCNSANAYNIAFVDKNGRLGFIKVQKNLLLDDLQGDVVVNKEINALCQKAQFAFCRNHFVTFDDAFPVILEEDGDSYNIRFDYYLNYKNDKPSYFHLRGGYIEPTGHHTFPSMITDGIANPVSLQELLNHYKYGQINSLEECTGLLFTSTEEYLTDHLLPALHDLFRALLSVSSELNFVHNDLHSSNILWSKEKKSFVVIDYGRSYVKVRNMQSVRDAIQKLGLEAVKLSLDERGNLTRKANVNALAERDKNPADGDDFFTDYIESNQRIWSDSYRAVFHDIAAVCYQVYKVIADSQYHPPGFEELSEVFDYNRKEIYIPSDEEVVWDLVKQSINHPEIVVRTLGMGMCWMVMCIKRAKDTFPSFTDDDFTELETYDYDDVFQRRPNIGTCLYYWTGVALESMTQVPGLPQLGKEFDDILRKSGVFIGGYRASRKSSSSKLEKVDKVETLEKSSVLRRTLRTVTSSTSASPKQVLEKTNKQYRDIMRMSELMRCYGNVKPDLKITSKDAPLLKRIRNVYGIDLMAREIKSNTMTTKKARALKK